MNSKNIVITGASDGIGAEAARQLKSLGHNVVIVGRNPTKTEKIAGELDVPFFCADFAKISDVVALAKALDARLPQVDVLCNNAGAAMDKRKLTQDGFEQTFQVNVLAPFLLTYLLKEKLCQSGAVVVQTASIAANLFANFNINDLQNEKEFSPLRAYGNAKLCGFLLTKQWHKHYGKNGLYAVAFQPGIPRTNFGSESTPFLNFAYHSPLKYLFTIPKSRSARRMVYFATAKPDVDFECGEFYTFKKKFKLKFRDKNDAISDQLWLKCEEIVKSILQNADL